MLHAISARDTFRLRLPAQASSVGVARRQVRSALSRWDLAELADDAGLVVSELFTNAVLHSGSEYVACLLWTAGGKLHVEIVDEGRGAEGPLARTAADGDENGRGLALVAHLAEGWGVRPPAYGTGRAVWATLSCARPGAVRRSG
ncbi:ATP-binding protein [Streptomyces sp. NPDC026673]|uniref:ATP-binding protein n=1 Tax=Streptomyces sp. NPDC026673 TaxID=3155724 RepID=UPI0033D1A452